MTTNTFKITKDQDTFVNLLLSGARVEDTFYEGDSATIQLNNSEITVSYDDGVYTFTVNKQPRENTPLNYQVNLVDLNQDTLTYFGAIGLSPSALVHRIHYDEASGITYGFGLLRDRVKQNITSLFIEDEEGLVYTTLNRINQFIRRIDGYNRINYSNLTRIVNRLIHPSNKPYTERQIENIFKSQGSLKVGYPVPHFQYQDILENKQREINRYVEDFKTHTMDDKLDIFSHLQLGHLVISLDILHEDKDLTEEITNTLNDFKYAISKALVQVMSEEYGIVPVE